MLTVLAILLGCAGAFTYFRNRLWFSMPLNAESFALCYYRQFDGAFIPHFKQVFTPLSLFFLGASFSKSIDFGRMLYTWVLAATGFFLGVSAYLLTGSTFVAAVSSLIMYATSMLPFSFDCEAEPEAFGNLFSSLSLVLVLLAANYNAPWVAAVAGVLGAMSLWCKVTAIDFLWGPCYLLAAGSPNKYMALYAIGWGAMMALYLILVIKAHILPKSPPRATSQHSLSEYIKYSIASDLKFRLAAGGLRQKATVPISQLLNHCEIIWPVLLTFYCFVASNRGDGVIVVFLSGMLAISCLHCLMRFQFRPLYFYMAHFPLAVGASLFVFKFISLSTYGVCLSILVLSIVAGLVRRAFVRYSFRPKWSKRIADINEDVVGYLQSHMNQGETFFQDSSFVMLYAHFQTKAPPFHFLWADRMAGRLQNEEIRSCFLEYFRNSPPTFLVLRSKKLNITYLEQISGRCYSLVHCKLSYVYKLATTVPSLGSAKDNTMDLAQLFSGSEQRFKRDISAFHTAAQKMLRDVEVLVSFKKFAAADRLLKQLESFGVGIPALHTLRSRVNEQMGNAEETVKA